jgi:mitogen-activated protein kinase kinase 1
MARHGGRPLKVLDDLDHKLGDSDDEHDMCEGSYEDDSKHNDGLYIHVDNKAQAEDSFDMDGETFIKGNLAINSTGVAMRDSPKSFTVVYEELIIAEQIGRGSSSVVHRATHRPTATPLALKIINMFDKSKREQLINEIKTLYDAQCPCLVSFYGACYREGAITIALEYMDGGSLANMVQQVGAVPEATLANIAYQVLYGLAYLKSVHRRVHRDIKPSNLLINSRGEVKITDFGISAELQNSIAMCATFVGTFKYMSPERIQSLPYSYASDIWSLGLVLLECATGEYPYPEDKTCIEMVQTVLESPIPSLPYGNSDEFTELISNCLRKEPNERLPADILLGSPWFTRYNAIRVDEAIRNTRSWIQEMSQ